MKAMVLSSSRSLKLGIWPATILQKMQLASVGWLIVSLPSSLLECGAELAQSQEWLSTGRQGEIEAESREPGNALTAETLAQGFGDPAFTLAMTGDQQSIVS